MIALPFVFNSCQSSGGDDSGGGTVGNASCKLQPLNTATLGKPEAPPVSPFASGKVRLHDGDGVSGFSKAHNGVVRAGSELAVLVDNNCERGNTSSANIFSKLVTATRPHPMIEKQTYTWVLSHDYNETEIGGLADENPCVIGVSWDREYKLQSIAINDPLYTQQEHFNFLSAGTAYDGIYNVAGGLNTTTGDAVKVAVVDTGIDWSHPDVQGNIQKFSLGGGAEGWGIDATTIGTSLIDYNPYDVSDNGHGTHVAGTIAAVTNNNTGVAGLMPYRAKIMAVKVFKRNSAGEMVTTSTHLANGLNFAANNGAKVINVSLGAVSSGTNTDPVIETALNYAIGKGSLVVTVIGNTDDGAGKLIDGTTTSSMPGQYATMNGVIGVGSIDTSSGNKSYFSNYSTTYTEIGAPGAVSSGAGMSPQGIYSSVPTGVSTSGYARLAGTSQAAPAVSAAAAIAYRLVKDAANVELTPAQLEELVVSSGIPTPSLQAYFKNGNRLNFATLVRRVNQVYPQTLGGRPLPGCP